MWQTLKFFNIDNSYKFKLQSVETKYKFYK